MIRYEGHISYIEDLKGDFSARILFGALKFKAEYKEDLDGGLYLFGYRIRTLDQIAEVQTAKIDNEPKHETDGSFQHYEEPTRNDTISNYKVKSSSHLADIETLKSLGRAGWHILTNVKDALVNVIKNSDSKLRKLIINVVKNILKQLLPRKICGDFKYGLDDPYYTAKILEIFALFYAKVGDDLRVEPVWNGYCFLGSVEYKGRIHISVILWNVLKLVLNSSFRRIWREYNGK